ncbi:BtpA/SgcQ family protein [Enterocloster hominis (ex Hitch et al. 2024)]|uniref:BtpA/SgcQ family protein n=1 Tax=Enterocloster hominis (ex Hitch et al. 2024) TaxID=1917870 RepID=A0ABV1D925_9FIRM
MGKSCRITGVVHLPPFGADRLDLEGLESWLLEQIGIHAECGITSMMIQDQTPGELAGLKNVAILSALGRTVKRMFPDLSLGIILEANNPSAAMYIANACGADFIRQKVFIGAMVKAGGVMTGRAGEVWEARKDMDRPVRVLTDIYDRTGVPLGPLPIETAAGQALKYGSDGLILTGKNFEESLDLADRVRKQYPQAPVYLGGGITEKNVGEAVKHCDGMIVSSCLLEDGKDNVWSRQKIRRFMECVCG